MGLLSKLASVGYKSMGGYNGGLRGPQQLPEPESKAVAKETVKTPKRRPLWSATIR